MTITAKSSTNVNAVICRFQLLRVIKSRNQDEASPRESEIQGKQLGLVLQKMNEVCFGNAYLDQPGIPFVLFMGGDLRLPEVCIDARGFEEMPCTIQIGYVLSCVVDPYQRSNVCVECWMFNIEYFDDRFKIPFHHKNRLP